MISWIDKKNFVESDIQKLKGDRAIETPTLEFKSDLSEKKGGLSEWRQGKETVSGYARDRLLSEIMAFANANGGFLVLGVEEDKGKPPRRVCALLPFPKVHDLYERLVGMCRDGIDPQIPNLQIHPVEIGGNGDGVIVFKIPRSPIRPHRLKSNGQVYMRQHLSCERVATMREVQDLVLTRYKQKFEAVWSVVFQTHDGKHAGVLTMANGRVFGGDSCFFYKGYYEAYGGLLFVTLTVTHYFGSNTTAWGDPKDKLSMEAAGMMENDNRIVGKLTRHDGNFPSLRFVLNRLDELP